MEDEGRPIAYELLERNVPVYAAGGEPVGTVDHVIAAPDLDIFHGIVIHSEGRRLFVAAEYVRALHERGVDLGIDTVAVAALAESEHGPSARQSNWRVFVDRMFDLPRH